MSYSWLDVEEDLLLLGVFLQELIVMLANCHVQRRITEEVIAAAPSSSTLVIQPGRRARAKSPVIVGDGGHLVRENKRWLIVGYYGQTKKNYEERRREQRRFGALEHRPYPST